MVDETKGSILLFSIAFALRSVRLDGRRLRLTETQRYEIAAATIQELRRYGGWNVLDEPAEVKQPGPSWMNGKPPD